MALVTETKVRNILHSLEQHPSADYLPIRVLGIVHAGQQMTGRDLHQAVAQVVACLGQSVPEEWKTTLTQFMKEA